MKMILASKVNISSKGLREPSRRRTPVINRPFSLTPQMSMHLKAYYAEFSLLLKNQKATTRNIVSYFLIPDAAS